ncbi:uncharacterized protein A1O9_09592 [Exophiala aquamarina CBS 119918]|uniref:Zn(2)-C6 fungal-type domain-containing protein n=1 Tax=Exophiala aquamarina CBS 119918 TaxID=1182545 RepID=A0A072PFV2_9EURO|nr:uncharacterized protein A1O9_09592 [Exophiala aquamarina CBS 119918]KEF54425.1 hypothetical protein A1O9_09592 [Exophiala aquamarina CBS 119918]
MTSLPERPAKAFSCIRCFERKVKCDKENPCSNCVKSRVECVFRVPPAPRRRKKRPQEEILLARLKHCEDLLRSKGIEVGTSETPGQGSVPSGPASHDPSLPNPDTGLSGNQPPGTVVFFPGPDARNGQLIVDHGKSRFIENNLWTSVSEEFKAKEAIEYEDDDEDANSPVEDNTDFMLGMTPSSNTVSISRLHPSPENIMKLWQIFLDNINPMTKLIHQPSFQKIIVQSMSQLDNLPRSLEALMFAIYTTAVFSLDDDESEMKLGESRKVLLMRYRHATRGALARAKFMATSELPVLQAFMLYLLSMRDTYDSRTLWTLAGVASRIAQGMGLHRDGSYLGVAPFESELRRRLWWQISILDFRSAELSGSGRFGDFGLSDTRTPSNVNDEDIFPEMTTEPVPQARPTEMIACLLRCEFGQFWKEKLAERKAITLEDVKNTAPWKTSLEERDAHINELEHRLEEKFLKYCDPSIPIQFLATIIARAAVNNMRLMAHHPRKYGNVDDLPQSERDFLWKVSLKLLESDNLAHSARGLKRFMWHTNEYFQWQAFIHLLNELKSKTLGDEVDLAWQQVEEVFENHPTFLTEQKKPLHAAVGSVCLKAFSARERALRETTNGVFPKVVPGYIRTLREQRIAAARRNTKQEPSVERLSLNSNPNTNTSFEQFSSPATAGAQHSNAGSGNVDPRFSFQMSPLHPQLPLPTSFQPFQYQAPSSDALMFTSDPALAQELAMSDMPMDWAQWDMLMKDLEIPK